MKEMPEGDIASGYSKIKLRGQFPDAQETSLGKYQVYLLVYISLPTTRLPPLSFTFTVKLYTQ